MFSVHRLHSLALTAALLLSIFSLAPRAAAQTAVDHEYFHRTLSAYGMWVQDPKWGSVWRPDHLPPGWRPYTFGSWAYTTDYGWTWVSDEPHGWVTYHYGRWVWSTVYGWVWLAGYEWAPAWVEWCYGGGYVGWAPAQPDFYWQGDYYYGSYACTSPAFYSHAVFVSERYYGRREMAAHTEPSSRNAVTAKATVNVTSYGRGSHGIVNRGVDVAKVEASTGRKIDRIRVVSSEAPVPLGADTSREMHIFRPTVIDGPTLDAHLPSQLQTDLPSVSASGALAAPDIQSRTPTSPLDSAGPSSSLSFPDVGGSRSLPSVGVGGGGLIGGGGGGGLLRR
jgi:uncharacterized protein DUF6600